MIGTRYPHCFLKNLHFFQDFFRFRNARSRVAEREDWTGAAETRQRYRRTMASSFGWGGVGTSVGPQDTPSSSGISQASDEPKTQSSTKAQNKSKKEVEAPPSASSKSAKADANGASQAQGRAGSVQLRMDELSRREVAVAEREAHVKELENKLKDGGIDIKPKNCESTASDTVLFPSPFVKGPY